MELRLEKVTHTYQQGSPFQATAIREVSFTVRDGDFTALIGHTGSGKSTLAQHLNGLLKPTEGRVTLDGEELIPEPDVTYTGSITVTGDYVPLEEDEETGFALKFMFGIEDGALVYVAMGSDPFVYVKVSDGERFVRQDGSF